MRAPGSGTELPAGARPGLRTNSAIIAIGLVLVAAVWLRAYVIGDYVRASIANVIMLLCAGSVLVVLARQRRTVDALARSETQFRATFDQAAIGIAHASASGRFLRVNKKLCDMLGYTEAGVAGAHLPRHHAPGRPRGRERPGDAGSRRNRPFTQPGSREALCAQGRHRAVGHHCGRAGARRPGPPAVFRERDPGRHRAKARRGAHGPRAHGGALPRRHRQRGGHPQSRDPRHLRVGALGARPLLARRRSRRRAALDGALERGRIPRS